MCRGMNRGIIQVKSRGDTLYIKKRMYFTFRGGTVQVESWGRALHVCNLVHIAHKLD